MVSGREELLVVYGRCMLVGNIEQWDCMQAD